MGIPQKSLVIGACEIACHYPELSLNDAAGDALQLAEKIRLCGIEETKRKRLSLSQLAVLSVQIKISHLKKR